MTQQKSSCSSFTCKNFKNNITLNISFLKIKCNRFLVVVPNLLKAGQQNSSNMNKSTISQQFIKLILSHIPVKF